MNTPVSLSYRLYRKLLRAYPPGFRAEYGDEMARTFRDECRAHYRQRGAAGVLGQWVETVPDFVVSVVDEHEQENFQMAKSTLRRVLAVAGLVGGALWVAYSVLLSLRAPGVAGGAYRETDDLGLLLALATGLAAAGLLSVNLGPARPWPVVTRGFLLLAAAGGLWTAFSPLFTENWMVFVAGYLVMMLCLMIGGFTLLSAPANRRWAVLFIIWAASMFLFNTEDWRALFGIVTGILAVATSALALSSALNRQSEPPVAAA